MQKKFWSALLSLAMIVSCFSGVTLASGGEDIGLPSQQMSAPSNVNIDMKEDLRITVRVPYSGGITLTGTVMAQGTESPTVRMDTAHVNELYESVTGTPGGNQTLLMGEVVDGTALYSNTLRPTDANNLSSVSSEAYRYFAKEFKAETNTVPRLWAVGSDGSYSVTFIPEVHTTKYYGFALSSLYNPINVTGNTYGVFEALHTSTSGTTVSEATYFELKAIQNALIATQTELANQLGSLQLASILADLTIINTAYGAPANIAAQMIAMVGGTTTGQTPIQFVDFIDTTGLADGSDLDEVIDWANVSTTAIAAPALKTALITAYQAIQPAVDNVAPVLDALIADASYAKAFDDISAVLSVYSDQIANLDVSELTTVNANRVANVSTALDNFAIGLSNIAADLDLSQLIDAYVTALEAYSDAIDTYLKDEVNGIFAATTTGTDYNNARDILLAAHDVVAPAAMGAKISQVDTGVNGAGVASLQNALTTAISAVTSVVNDAWAASQTSITGLNRVAPKDRYIQNTPLTVRYMYKLSGSAATYPAGTSGNHVISGTIVTSDDQTIPYDFNYEVRAGGASGQLIATGRTQNGYFSFTMNTMFNQSIYLYPTERYAYVANTGASGGGSYQYIPLSPSTKAAEQFPYTVAEPQRRDFIKSELEETTMTSEIVSKPIRFTDLYTYNEALGYSVLDSQITFNDPSNAALHNVTASGFNNNLAEVYLYGVSYVVYDGNGKVLGKDYSIKANGDVTWNWAWNKPATSLIDSTGTTNTPRFVIDKEGYLAVPLSSTSVERAYFAFTSSGNATLRVRQTGRQNISSALEESELYQAMKTIYVEAPGQVTVVAGHELKYLSKTQDATLIQLHSLSSDIKSVRMSKISYDDKADIKHTLEVATSQDAAKANAKGTTLTYYLSGNNIYMYMPWDLVKQGGSDIEITCDFLNADGHLVTSRVITIKNLLWKVTSEQSVLTVQENNTFDAIVTDGDDVEQNSAMLKLCDDNNSDIKSPLARNVIRNIVGGRYTFNNARPMAGGDVYLFVQETTGEESGIKAMATLQALGKADIDAVLTDGKDKVVTGLAKTLEFNATNAAGSAETGLVNAQLYSLDGVTKNTNFANYDSLKLVHAGSGRYTLSLVNLKPGSYILRVSTMNMTHYADIEFEALPLTIVYPDEFGILTWDTEIKKNSNFYDANKMEFTVLDPMTDKEVYVEIKDDIAFVLENGDESEMGAVLRSFESGSTTRYISGYTVSFSDKDFLPYNMKSNRSTHEFWVGLEDVRSDVVRAEEGDLSLRFNFVVRENNSTGASNDVEGMVIPIGLPSLEVNPTSVNRNTTTTVTLTVKDANGRPASGVQIRPDVESYIAARTNADGETQYLFTPMVTGNTKRFDIAGFEGSAQVYAILNIVDDNEVPVIALNPYISKTAKDAVEISGIVSDNLGLQLFTVDNTMVNMTLTGKTSYEFAFTVSLRVGENKIRMVVQDNSGQFTEKTITIIRNMPSVVIMTLGSTEVIGATGLDVEPVVSNGRTMLPIRFIFQDILGGEVVFDAATQTITADVMGHNIVMTVGSNEARVDGAKVTLLTAPYIVEEAGRTLAPIREILEAIGVKVDFEPTALTVTVTGGGDVDEYTDTDLIAPAGATVGNTDEEVIDETEEIDQTDETEEIDETEEVDETDETEEGDDEDAEGTVG